MVLFIFKVDTMEFENKKTLYLPILAVKLNLILEFIQSKVLFSLNF